MSNKRAKLNLDAQPAVGCGPWAFGMDASAVRIAVVLCGVLSLCGGCTGYSAAAHRVEPNAARSALERVLSSWQRGESIESCQAIQPPVVVQDMEWKAGEELIGFEIQGVGEAVDANLRCQVKLTLRRPQRGKQDATVTYLVGTSPVITVFRAPGS